LLVAQAVGTRLEEFLNQSPKRPVGRSLRREEMRELVAQGGCDERVEIFGYAQVALQHTPSPLLDCAPQPIYVDAFDGVLIEEAPQVERGRDGRTLKLFDHLVTYVMDVAVVAHPDRGAASYVDAAEIDLTAHHAQRPGE
jgi:hypothetical protein